MNQGTATKPAFSFLILAGQDMAVIGSSPLYLAGPGLPDTLGGSPVCLNLGHFILR